MSNHADETADRDYFRNRPDFNDFDVDGYEAMSDEEWAAYDRFYDERPLCAVIGAPVNDFGPRESDTPPF